MEQFKCELCQKVCKNQIGFSIHSKACAKKYLGEAAEVKPPDGVTPPVAAKTESVKAPPIVAPEDIKPEDYKYDFSKWKELPPPVQKHLERTWGDWINHIEVSQEWRDDFGGYALTIRVPKQYSTEWEQVEYLSYDNATRRSNGSRKIWKEDVRRCSLRDLARSVQWIDLVKNFLLVKAYSQGIRMPNANTGSTDIRQSFDEYKKQIAGI